MTERLPARPYTLDEIDRLRDAARVFYGLSSSLRSAELEDRIRTLMYAGIDPSEMEARNTITRQREIRRWREQNG